MQCLMLGRTYMHLHGLYYILFAASEREPLLARDGTEGPPSLVPENAPRATWTSSLYCWMVPLHCRCLYNALYRGRHMNIPSQPSACNQHPTKCPRLVIEDTSHPSTCQLTATKRGAQNSLGGGPQRCSSDWKNAQKHYLATMT